MGRSRDGSKPEQGRQAVGRSWDGSQPEQGRQTLGWGGDGYQPEQGRHLQEWWKEIQKGWSICIYLQRVDSSIEVYEYYALLVHVCIL